MCSAADDPTTHDTEATTMICDKCGTPLLIDLSRRTGRCDDCRAVTAPPTRDDNCWPLPCRDYHDTWAHQEGEDPCACVCHTT